MKIRIDLPQSINEIGSRDNQEDALYPAVGSATANERVFVLCDGMGGHDHGEVASQAVCTAISQYILTNWPADGRVGDYLILDAIEVAFKALDAKDSDTLKKMGTTLTLVILHEGGCTAAHIGDSRIYHIRPSECKVLYRSRDHSLVTDLYQAGEISFEEMSTSPQKNIITKAMQPGEDNRVKPDIVHIGNLRPGDYIYMCSDGMMEQMDDQQLTNFLCVKDNDSYKIKKLIEETACNSDNHSAHLIRICEVTMDENEAIVDDESTVRCNFLNIHPIVAEAEVVDEEQRMEEERNKDIPVQTLLKERCKWLWVLVVVILALILYTLVNLCGNKDKDSKELKQEVPMNITIQSSSAKKATQPPKPSELGIHEIKHNKPEK